VNNFDVFLIKFDQYIQSWVASSTLGFPAIKHVPKDHMYHPMLQHAGQPAATSCNQLIPAATKAHWLSTFPSLRHPMVLDDLTNLWLKTCRLSEC
jgi:hypothetical protein